MNQPACWENNFSLRKKSLCIKRPSLWGPYQSLILQSDNEDYYNPLGSKKPGLLKAPVSVRPMDIIRFTQKNLDQII